MPAPPIASRSDLIDALRRAAAVEHAVICRYLFAGFSMKTRPDEGVSWPQLERMRGWHAATFRVAREEMAHLGIVCNLLTAIGAMPHFAPPRRPLHLLRFGETALEAFIAIEREHLEEDRGADSIGSMYGRIRDGFDVVSRSNATLFAGSPDSQVDNAFVGVPSGWHDVWLPKITNLASAHRAIDHVVESSRGQMEEPGLPGQPKERGRGDANEAKSSFSGRETVRKGHEDAEASTPNHVEQFEIALKELMEERRRDPGFEPSRPVVEDPTVRGDGGAAIRNATAGSAAALFNAAYETMLLMLLRLYAPAGESRDERDDLVGVVFLPLMTMVIRPLGEMLTRMRFDEAGESRAGPTFECSAEISLPPDPAIAWMILQERLDELADRSEVLLRLLDRDGTFRDESTFRDDGLRNGVQALHEDLRRIAQNFRRFAGAGAHRTQILLSRLLQRDE